MLTFDYLLAFGIVGFYIYDSAILMFYNEFLIFKKINSQFGFQTVPRSFNFFKKYLLIPHLLCPNRLIFKNKWYLDKRTEKFLLTDISNITQLSQHLKWLQCLNIGVSFFTLLVLPICLLLRCNHVVLATIILLIYSLNILCLMMVIYKKQSLNLTGLKIFHLSLDVLLCPPFAVNLIRKITLNQEIKSDGVDLAQHFFDKKQFQSFLYHMTSDLQNLKESYPDTHPNLESLIAKQRALEALVIKQEL